MLDDEGMDNNNTTATMVPRPTPAFVGASWTVLGLGMLSFLIGLWNGGMPMMEKGFYFSLLLFGLFGVVSLQKAVRDSIEGVPVTPIYHGLSWVAVGSAVLLLTIGLWEADMVRFEKGFYGMSYVLALFAAVAVQKNTRDLAAFPRPPKPEDGDDGFLSTAIEELKAG